MPTNLSTFLGTTYQGAQGTQGIQGSIGAQGNQGVQGSQGIQGSQGYQGTGGSVGAQGNQGVQGSGGSVGAQGNQGVQGSVGAQGNQGVQGAQGAAGTGSQGVQGAQGIQGAAGPQTTINATDSGTTSTVHYPVFVAGTGAQTARIRNAGATDFSFQPSTGDLIAPGNVTAYSDIKLKENIKELQNALSSVMSLRGVEYNRIDLEGNPKHIGLIAQEVEKIVPEVVRLSTNKSGEELKVISYPNLIALLIQAIKEQQEEINTIKKRFEE